MVCIIIDLKCEEKHRVLPVINLWLPISSAHFHQARPCKEVGGGRRRDELEETLSGLKRVL